MFEAVRLIINRGKAVQFQRLHLLMILRLRTVGALLVIVQAHRPREGIGAAAEVIAVGNAAVIRREAVDLRARHGAQGRGAVAVADGALIVAHKAGDHGTAADLRQFDAAEGVALADVAAAVVHTHQTAGTIAPGIGAGAGDAGNIGAACLDQALVAAHQTADKVHRTLQHTVAQFQLQGAHRDDVALGAAAQNAGKPHGAGLTAAPLLDAVQQQLGGEFCHVPGRLLHGVDVFLLEPVPFVIPQSGHLNIFADDHVAAVQQTDGPSGHHAVGDQHGTDSVVHQFPHTVVAASASAVALLDEGRVHLNAFLFQGITVGVEPFYGGTQAADGGDEADAPVAHLDQSVNGLPDGVIAGYPHAVAAVVFRQTVDHHQGEILGDGGFQVSIILKGRGTDDSIGETVGQHLEAVQLPLSVFAGVDDQQIVAPQGQSVLQFLQYQGEEPVANVRGNVAHQMMAAGLEAPGAAVGHIAQGRNGGIYFCGGFGADGPGAVDHMRDRGNGEAGGFCHVGDFGFALHGGTPFQ